MRTGSLFSGYGGLDLGVRAAIGGSVAWHAEIDPAACKVLAHHYPDTPNLGDITATDWDQVEAVELVTAGWPCQPWSYAGKRKGTDDARALWPEVARAIRLLRPGIVVLENVPGIVTAGELARVADSLADLGYRFAWTCLGADAIGAPHRRHRMFILAAADTDDLGHDRYRRARGRWRGPENNGVTASDSTNTRRREREAGGRLQYEEPREGRVLTADTAGDGRHQGRTEPAKFQRVSDAALCGDVTATHADSAGQQGTEPASRPDLPAWGDYEPAIRRWEHVTGRPAPAPTQQGKRGGQQLSPAFVEWLMGLPAGHVTDVPGLTRNDCLRLLGNGVVPQQAAAAITWLYGQITAEQAGDAA